MIKKKKQKKNVILIWAKLEPSVCDYNSEREAQEFERKIVIIVGFCIISQHGEFTEDF